MKVIVAVDGTRNSALAVDALIGLNLSADSEIKVMTVVPSEEHGFSLPFFGAPAKSAEQQTQLLEGTKKALQELLAKYASAINCKNDCEVVQGDAKGQIVEAAKSFSANMILLGASGNKGSEHPHLGSVSQGVLTMAPCPVVVIKSKEGSSSALKGGFQNVLIAVDNSAYSKAAINWVKGINWGKGAKVRLVTVVPVMAGDLDSEQAALNVADLMIKQEAVSRLADSELETLANELQAVFTGPDAVSFGVIVGDPREAILNAAEDSHADLIVMGSHGKTGWTKLFIGSVSQAVATHAACSVAIVRGLVPQNKSGAMAQSGMFVAENKEELYKKVKELARELGESEQK